MTEPAAIGWYLLFGGVAAGALLFLLRQAGVKMIEKHIELRMSRLLAEHQESLHLIRVFRQHSFDASQALPLLVGKTRNMCRQALEDEQPSQETLSRLLSTLEELETVLYKYSLLLDPDTYLAIHSFKERARDCLRAKMAGSGSREASRAQCDVDSLRRQIDEERVLAIQG